MSFTEQDVTLVLALLAFVFWQESNSTILAMRAYYNKNKEKITLAPPDFIFGIMWPILYSLIVLSGYFAYYSGHGSNSYFIPSFIFFVLNVFLNKRWSVYFFDMQNPMMALWVLIPMMISSLLYSIFVAIDGVGTAFWLMLPYNIWIWIPVFVWNVQWILGERKKIEKEEDLPKGQEDRMGFEAFFDTDTQVRRRK